MISTLLLLVAAIYALGILLAVTGMLKAPFAYEDDNGFHYGQSPEANSIATFRWFHRRLTPKTAAVHTASEMLAHR